MELIASYTCLPTYILIPIGDSDDAQMVPPNVPPERAPGVDPATGASVAHSNNSCRNGHEAADDPYAALHHWLIFLTAVSTAGAL